MARWTFLAAGFTLVACGGGSSDLCTRAINVANKIDTETSTCIGSATAPSASETSSDIAQCKQELASCTAQDQSTLNTAVSCLENLPAFQCQWITDEEQKGTEDQAEITWGSQGEICINEFSNISPACGAANGIDTDGGF